MNTRLVVLSTALICALAIVGCGKSAETGIAPKATTVGTEIDDSVVTARVKSALLGDPDIKGFDFQVETRKGEVQLSGFVDSQMQIDHAIYIAGKVEGVKQVSSNVSLKGSAASVGNTIDDGILTARVKSALLADPTIKSLDIAVVTRKGQVQLSGFVNNQGQINRAMELVRGIEGVRSIGNEMSIKK